MSEYILVKNYLNVKIYLAPTTGWFFCNAAGKHEGVPERRTNRSKVLHKLERAIRDEISNAEDYPIVTIISRLNSRLRKQR